MQSLELLINSIEPSKLNEVFKEMLTTKINELMMNDFPALIQLLYRIDIPEKKLKEITQGHKQEDIAHLVAEMIIERQLEKARLRKLYRDDNDIAEDERW